MENNTEIIDNPSDKELSLTLSPEATKFLLEAGKWGKFLSILGFCFLGIIVISGLLIGKLFYFSSMPYPSFLISIIYIIIGTIHFYPIYYLFNFSTNIQKALNEKDSLKLEKAFENLKSQYKFIGILVIVILSFYLFFGLFFLLGLFLNR